MHHMKKKHFLSLLHKNMSGGMVRIAVIAALVFFAVITFGGIGLILLLFFVVVPFIQSIPTEGMTTGLNLQAFFTQLGIPVLPAAPTDVNSAIDMLQQQYLNTDQEGQIAGEETQEMEAE